ncbi:procollagen-lysine,2-oxoglutarate 5-dioxygenase 1-like isoform X2 [Liolophura sinensis]|uniref:procollagen-lysine,2-oxoglutarate 5-dioxygenase 1-like isoform X2 n=1 Tax=Liolophura sinensis TaxID=3198878 RepID=UPI003158FF43
MKCVASSADNTFYTFICSLTALFLYSLCTLCEASSLDEGLLVTTIATEENDGFKRFLKTAQQNDLDVKVFGLGQVWDGGDVKMFAGGGHKVNLLRKGLEEYKDRSDLIIMFVDSYDLIFLNGAKEILDKFKKLNSRVVFSAEGFCWPDANLMNKYPVVSLNEKRYLNSGGFIGYAKDIYEIVSHDVIKNRDDDQLYYTKIYLDPELRKKWSIRLDNRGEIFQNLNGALDEIVVKFKEPNSYLYNIKTGTTPIVVHGNGPIKVEFNRMAAYLTEGWTPTGGCKLCKEDTISLEGLKEEDFPTVMMGIFIERPTPFITEFFWNIGNLTYPKQKIDIIIHNAHEYHRKDVVKFTLANKGKYNSVQLISPDQEMTEWNARNAGLDECIKRDCQYYFSLDSTVQITNTEILEVLIEQNRTVIAPMMVRPFRLWSNFWGALDPEGWYSRSEDYVDLVEFKKKGLWNVPHVTQIYLIHGHMVQKIKGAFINGNLDADMAFTKTIRDMGNFMTLTNLEHYGHLVNNDYFDTSHVHNEMWQIFDNPFDWELRYLHENYTQALDPNTTLLQPCPDVYWFPIFTPAFTLALIDEMENLGTWSNGQNSDPRLAGGYENVPTIDIHMNQIGYEREWLYIIQKYVSPIQQKAFTGYFHDPPTSIMNFVVRYKPDEQPSLRPHHDSSTYTINLALNRPGIDYQGGGCRFIRYNCSVTALRQGWMLMHPGRLTHYHEGLKTTAGTRYIMISFVDP